MLTPKFSLRQNAEFLFIKLHVPYIKAENAECDANRDEFYFSAKPYYLRLHLPCNIVNDDRLKSEYDVGKGDLNIRVAKEVPGQKFEGLDLLTKLLTPKRNVGVPNIEVIGTGGETNEKNSQPSFDKDSGHDTPVDDAVCSEEFDWFVEQKIPVDEHQNETIIKTPHYGFAHQKSNVIGDVCSEIGAIDLKDPDNVSVLERTILRQKQEDDKFDCEHYLADLFDDDMIQDVISINYPFLTGEETDKEFSDNEKERLIKLPRREYLIEHSTLTQVCLGLVDLVYAYSYNYRFCGGETNVESDWTICKLSATLSWLDSFHNLKDVVISCARRTLCFPLYRSWKLFEKVLRDVKCIFKAGKHHILKCLLGIHSILETSESHYLLNDLYITDYCVWIQTVDSQVIDSLVVNLSKVEISKADVGFSLVDIETDAEKLMSEYQSDDDDVDELSKKMMNVVHVADLDFADSDDNDEKEEGDEDDSDDEETETEDDTDSEDGNGEGDHDEIVNLNKDENGC